MSALLDMNCSPKASAQGDMRISYVVSIGSSDDPVTWYKITRDAGTQGALWDFKNKGRSRWTGTSCFVSEVPLCNLRLKPSKKNTFLVRISLQKESGRAVFFVIYCFLLHASFTHYYLPPGIRWRSNVIKTKHKILI